MAGALFYGELPSIKVNRVAHSLWASTFLSGNQGIQLRLSFSRGELVAVSEHEQVTTAIGITGITPARA